MLSDQRFGLARSRHRLGRGHAARHDLCVAGGSAPRAGPRHRGPYWRIVAQIQAIEARLVGYLRTDVNDVIAGYASRHAGHPGGLLFSARRNSLSRLARHGPNLSVDGNPIAIAWDEPMAGVGRCWFECPMCYRRCRHPYLRDPIACRRCHKLDYSFGFQLRVDRRVHDTVFANVPGFRLRSS